MIDIKIKENSWLAKLAAKKLGAHSAAIVIGRTIHLHHATRQHFLKSQRWVRHEVAHVKQYERLGVPAFIFTYLLKSLSTGYFNNPFEIEARHFENDETVLENVRFI